jgi:mannosyltransferase OCH1-like enzyme
MEFQPKFAEDSVGGAQLWRPSDQKFDGWGWQGCQSKNPEYHLKKKSKLDAKPSKWTWKASCFMLCHTQELKNISRCIWQIESINSSHQPCQPFRVPQEWNVELSTDFEYSVPADINLYAIVEGQQVWLFHDYLYSSYYFGF